MKHGAIRSASDECALFFKVFAHGKAVRRSKRQNGYSTDRRPEGMVSSLGIEPRTHALTRRYLPFCIKLHDVAESRKSPVFMRLFLLNLAQNRCAAISDGRSEKGRPVAEKSSWPQQPVISIRISEALRSRLERLKEVLAKKSGNDAQHHGKSRLRSRLNVTATERPMYGECQRVMQLLLVCRGFLAFCQIPLVEKNQGVGSVERIPLHRLLASCAQGDVHTAVLS